MSKFYQPLAAILILSLATAVIVSVTPSNAIGAQLENPTIKDMFFGFVVAGQISHDGGYDLREADRISDDMMRFRGKR